MNKSEIVFGLIGPTLTMQKSRDIAKAETDTLAFDADADADVARVNAKNAAVAVKPRRA